MMGAPAPLPAWFQPQNASSLAGRGAGAPEHTDGNNFIASPALFLFCFARETKVLAQGFATHPHMDDRARQRKNISGSSRRIVRRRDFWSGRIGPNRPLP